LNYLRDLGVELPPGPEAESRKSILTQAVGSTETIDVKVTYCQVRQRDALLLCSDGLYNMVPPAEILAAVNEDETLAGRCKSLINKAIANGGSDNITVILAEFGGAGLPPPSPDAAVEFKQFSEKDFLPGPD